MEELMPLLSAAKVGDVVNIRRLVAEGADVNLPGAGGVRPLLWAAQEGHVDAVRVLVKVGAEVEAATDDDGSRPLHTRRHGTDMWQ